MRQPGHHEAVARECPGAALLQDWRGPGCCEDPLEQTAETLEQGASRRQSTFSRGRQPGPMTQEGLEAGLDRPPWALAWPDLDMLSGWGMGIRLARVAFLLSQELAGGVDPVGRARSV